MTTMILRFYGMLLERNVASTYTLLLLPVDWGHFSKYQLSAHGLANNMVIFVFLQFM